MEEFNLRQINLMEKKLEFYKLKQLSLHELISVMEGLLNSLTKEIPESWKKQVQSLIGVLDQDYAVSLYKNEPLDNFKESIDSTLSDMQLLISNV